MLDCLLLLKYSTEFALSSGGRLVDFKSRSLDGIVVKEIFSFFKIYFSYSKDISASPWEPEKLIYLHSLICSFVSGFQCSVSIALYLVERDGVACCLKRL